MLPHCPKTQTAIADGYVDPNTAVPLPIKAGGAVIFHPLTPHASRDNTSGGFSNGKPWLPVTPAHLGRAVSVQADDPDSMLNHYRRALAFRRAHPTLRDGAIDGPRALGDVTMFHRMGEDDIYCAFNLGEAPATVPLPDGDWMALGTELGGTKAEAVAVTLGPWEFCLMKKR